MRLEGNDNIISKKIIAFSLAVIEYAELLDNTRKSVIPKQLLRSATSILNDLHAIDKIVIKIISTSKQQLIVKSSN